MILRSLAAAGWLAAVAAASSWAQSAAVPEPPSISHEPVTLAVRGQPLSILARVTPGAAPIRTVNLYYGPSRDAAPVQVAMSSSGAAMYLGTIPASHFQSSSSIFYYIEVIDAQEEWAETPWQEVRVQDPRSVTESVVKDPLVPAGRPPAPRQGGMTTGKWIAGGALAAGAAVAIIAATDSGGGGGSSNNNGDPPPPPPDDDDPPPDDDPIDCTDDDVVGTWLSLDQTVAPGFRILADGSTLFFAPPDGEPDTGSWGRIGCTLTLIPLNPDSVYRGTGILSGDRTTLTINGSIFAKAR